MKAIAFAIAVGLVASDCRGQKTQALGSESASKVIGRLLAQARDDGLALGTFVVQDTAGPNEIAIAYVLVNRGGIRTVRIDPELFVFDITDPDGQNVVPSKVTEPGFTGGLAELALPEGGYFGRVARLSCLKPFKTTGAQDSTNCLARYTLSKEGRYRLSVSYLPPAARIPSQLGGPREKDLESDTIAFFVRLPPR